MSRLINTRSSLWREAKSRTGANLGQACANALKAYTASTKPSTQELAHLTGKVRLRACGYRILTSTPQLARFLREMQQYELAESFFQKALHLTETVFGEYSKQAGKMNYMLAECYWNQSKMDEAQPYCEKSLAIRERILGGHHLEVAMSLCGLGGMSTSRNHLSIHESSFLAYAFHISYRVPQRSGWSETMRRRSR